jgi:hypothetical protein
MAVKIAMILDKAILIVLPVREQVLLFQGLF